MKAIHVDTTREDRPLLWQETAEPTLGPDEVLVEN